jgi:hypothetical protein
MKFVTSYVSYGHPFYIHVNDEKHFVAKVFGRWVYADDLEGVIDEIDYRCDALISQSENR